MGEDNSFQVGLSHDMPVTDIELGVVERPTYDPSRTVPPLMTYSIPDELGAALASSPVASENFRNMAHSHGLMYASWLSTAKKPETGLKRAARGIELLAENKRLVDVFGIRKKP